MKRILCLLFVFASVTAQDVVTVSPGGTVIIGGTTPSAPAAPAEVTIGGGQINAGGVVTSVDSQVSRATPAAGAQVVRGDDPRLAKAWVNFKGDVPAGVITPRDQFNISKVEKLGSGEYTVTFATPMASSNYIVTFAFNGISHGLIAQIDETRMAATGFSFSVVQSGASGYKFPSNAMIVVFGR